MKTIIPIAIILLLSGCGNGSSRPKVTTEEVTQAWTTGKTLDVNTFKQLSKQMPVFGQQPVKDDRGYNVLVDLAHECSFATLWGLPERLNQSGYRAIGSHATVNTVLDPRGVSRVRILWDTVNKIYPFAWWPNARYNVIITEQSNPDDQGYTDQEVEAIVHFVKKGGGLLIQGGPVKPGQELPINKLAAAFGGRFSDRDTTAEGIKWAVLETGEGWKPLGGEEDLKLSAISGLTVVASMKTYGKGKVILCGSLTAIRKGGKDSDDRKALADHLFDTFMTKLTEKQKPVGGTLFLPQVMDGGGAIYPELEDHFSNIVFYYAANQKPDLLKTVTEDVPKAQAFVEKQLPSTPTAEPMYLILCAGGGGGWAVNIYRPKENGIISLDGYGILSIFGHELAHTMFGPAADDGSVGGIAPIPDRGEAHAGWFQGKVNALFKPELMDRPNRDCNQLFAYDPKGNAMDLATCYENEEMNKKWGYAKDWIKTWYIWQKLDDRYGADWYPKWKYVQHTRWKDDPQHHLSWDEMVEDMSIAVGEDLFPFFIKLGTTLDHKRMPPMEFQGKTVELKVAPIEVTEAGGVKFSAIAS